MTKIKAVIIEDEIPAARLLMSMVSTMRPEWDVEIIPGCIDDAVEWFNTNEHPDLIFLDIHLSDGDAFEFLTEAKPDSAIIFTTAYDQYAVRAFSYNSIDYILKPVDDEHLSKAIEKFESTAGQQDNGKYLELILDTLKAPARKYRNRFVISCGDELRVLQVDSISYFYTEEKVTYAVTADGREHAIDVALNHLEEQLDPQQFFRVNRQFILNIDCIDRAMPYHKGRMLVKVHPSFRSEIIVSEGRSAAFRVWLNY
ncbi:MAG: LytR/AlgR family response regulator transcription factor [Candidatus Cryptobacteroides sp.]